MSDEMQDMRDQLANMDFSDVDHEMPLLAPGIVEVEVTNCEWKTAQNTGGSYLSMELTTTEDAKGKNVETVPAGAKLFHNHSVTKTKKYDPLRNSAAILMALFGRKDMGFKPEEFLGRSAKVKIGYSERDGSARNNISHWMTPKPDDTPVSEENPY